MRFNFPIIIIDEDFRSENASGLGIRALADALEKEGLDVLGVTSYGDLASFAQQQSRASAFILSIDDEEFTLGTGQDPIVHSLRTFIEEVRRKFFGRHGVKVGRVGHRRPRRFAVRARSGLGHSSTAARRLRSSRPHSANKGLTCV